MLSIVVCVLLAIFGDASAIDAKGYNRWFEDQIKGTLLPAPEVSCDWLLPDAGILRRRITVICPSNCLDVRHCGRVKGSSPYTVHSPVCLSAIHAGVIDAARGGGVVVTVTDGLDHYESSTKFGVASLAYGSYFNSFVVEKSDVTCGPTPAPTDVSCISSAILDLVFVADSSLSVGAEDFRLEKKFIKDIVGLFNIAPDKTRVGLNTFNTFAKTRFTLDKYKTREEVDAAIDDIKFETGGTYVGKALWQVVWDMKFRKEDAVRKIVVVFTDGRSADSVRRPVDKLESEGVDIIAFGVGEIKEATLLQIAEDDRDNVYSVATYGDLKNYLGSLIKRICTFVMAGARK